MTRIGYFLSCEEYGPRELLEQARMAEQAGFEVLWISDHYHPWNSQQGQSAFVWSVVGGLSQATNLPVTTGVTCPRIRIHPAIIAQAAATSAVMLGGKFALGVGSGENLNEHILGDLAVEGGYVHAGPPGAGHFTKLVHNGIEFGMLQAIGEGIDLLERYRDRLEVDEILRAWSHGSVIRSWLIDLMEEAYRANGGLRNSPAYVEDTGEVNWLVDDAMQMEVPAPVISQSVIQLFASRDDQPELGAGHRHDAPRLRRPPLWARRVGHARAPGRESRELSQGIGSTIWSREVTRSP